MLFPLEGFPETDEEPAVEPVNESARLTRETVARLLQPRLEDEALYSAALMAAQASGGDLEAIAAVLVRVGFSVKLCSSAGGSLSSLKHTYISATRNAVINGEPAEWVVDPSFAHTFAVANATPRYNHILSAIPPLLVAPLGRLVRVVLLLGAELARNFEAQGMPLPPWRFVDSIVSKYDAISSVAVHGGGSGLAALPRPPHTPAAAAAARRQQLAAAQQRERVQLRLARLGLQAPQTDAAMQAEAPSSVSSSSGGHDGVDSPKSVLETGSQGSLPRGSAFEAHGHQCFCCGCQHFRQRQRQGPAACKACSAAAASAA